MPENMTNGSPTLVQRKAWRRQPTKHYLNQFWPRYMSSYIPSLSHDALNSNFVQNSFTHNYHSSRDIAVSRSMVLPNDNITAALCAYFRNIRLKTKCDGPAKYCRIWKYNIVIAIVEIYIQRFIDTNLCKTIVKQVNQDNVPLNAVKYYFVSKYDSIGRRSITWAN